MEALAIAIFLSTVLFLVDKNQKWLVFWKVMRHSAIAIAAVAICGGSAFYVYERHEAKLRAAAPDFIPASDEFDQYKRPPTYSDLPPGAKVVSIPPWEKYRRQTKPTAGPTSRPALPASGR